MNTAVMSPFPAALELSLPFFGGNANDRANDNASRRLWLAVGVSLLVHGMSLGWLPGMSNVEPEPLPPLTIRLAAEPVPPAVAVSPAPTFTPRVEPRPTERPRAITPTPVLAVPATTASTPPSFSVPVVAAPTPVVTPIAPPVEAPRPVMRATPSPTDPVSLAGYGRDVASAVARHQRYPRLAQMRQWQGTALLQLQITAEGKLADARVLSSSGHEILDRQALDMVREAVPLPPLPTALSGRALTVDVPVTFRLAS